MHVSNMAISSNPEETEQMRGESSSPSAHQYEPTSAFYPEVNILASALRPHNCTRRYIEVPRRYQELGRRIPHRQSIRVSFPGPRAARGRDVVLFSRHPVVDGRVARTTPERCRLFFLHLSATSFRSQSPPPLETRHRTDGRQDADQHRWRVRVRLRLCLPAMNNSTSTGHITSW